MNERYTLLYDRTHVHQAIARMASEITGVYDGEDPLFVSLLHGSAPFTAQLAAEMARQAPDFHPHVDYMITSRNLDRILPDSLEPDVRLPLSNRSNVEGRPIVVLDNVLDQGNTYAYVETLLKKRGAKTVELAVLVEKTFPRTNGVSARYVGFPHTPVGFLVGMGMVDHKVSEEAYRWAGDIWQVRGDDDVPPQHSEPHRPLVKV